MRLLHITKSAAPEYGGPIAATLDQHSVTRGYVTREILTCDAPTSAFIRDFPFPVHAFGPQAQFRAPGILNRALNHYGYNHNMITWLQTHVKRFDAVIVDGLWNYSTWAASRVLPFQNVPYFVFPHGMLDPWFARKNCLKNLSKQTFWSLCEGPLLAQATEVFFTAEDERKLAKGSFWGHQNFEGRIVPFGTVEPPASSSDQLAAFRAHVPKLSDRPFLLYLSRIHEKKGCDLLIQAFASLAEHIPDTDLVIAGPEADGWGETLRQMACELGVENRIHWPGMLRGEAKWGAFRAAQAFILPSHQENFGIVIAEAMACGTPVLTTRRVNIWREVEASGGAFIADDSVAGTKELISRFTALTPDNRTSMGHLARKGFETYYRLENTAQGIIDAISEGISSSKGVNA